MMTQISLETLTDRLNQLGISYVLTDALHYTLHIDATHWFKVTQCFADLSARFAGLWADIEQDHTRVYALFCYNKHYVLMSSDLAFDQMQLASISTIYPAANRLERHCRDLTGVQFIDSPDHRRWTKHQAWKDKEFPLQPQFPTKSVSQEHTVADSHYPFFQTQGSAVCEVPVGPIHAGIIEPGHFRFQVVGETVLNLEERLGYTHKGIEKIAVGKTPQQLLKLACRVSGDSAVAHSWAAAMAIEQSAQIKLPERAVYLRAILLERERIANHVGDIGAICNDVGFAFAHMQTSRLRELWQRDNFTLFKHRLLMDTLTIGGVSHDISAEQQAYLLQQLERFEQDFSELIHIIQDYPSLEDRLATTGYLPHETAKALGCLGYVGRASGIDVDVRRDNPYPPYDKYRVQHVLFKEGDVLARLQVRVEEVRSSIKLLNALLHGLSVGEIQTQLSSFSAQQGIGLIAGWRGETLAFIRLNDDGTVARYFPRDPSWFNWPALEALIDDNIIADFPVCNKSVNGSYSGVDL
jgi:Ni,Fe-hydrogenase III large subunit/Ni,Fe-hydrogenase III component G